MQKDREAVRWYQRVPARNCEGLQRDGVSSEQGDRDDVASHVSLSTTGIAYDDRERLQRASYLPEQLAILGELWCRVRREVKDAKMGTKPPKELHLHLRHLPTNDGRRCHADTCTSRPVHEHGGRAGVHGDVCP